MHQDRFDGVADGRTGGFRVENDIRRHFDVCVFVDIHVAVADAGLNDRYLGVFHHGADKPCAAARNEQIEVLRHAHELHAGRAGGILYKLNAVAREAGGFYRIAQHLGDGIIGAKRFLAAAQNDGTARHKAQRSRVARHVRTSFVNDADNAHRHRDFFHFKPFGVRFAA